LASALTAIEGLDAEQSRACRQKLRVWGDALAQQKRPEAAGAQARLLADFLGGELGFQGDLTDYYNPRNSYLSQVIERRRGLPILLAAIWILVGRRAGVPVDGVGLPGHFIVRVGGRGGVLADPFSGGLKLSRSDCQAIVRRLRGASFPWSDSYLAVTPLDDLLERVLRNLSGILSSRGEAESLYRIIRFLLALRPGSAAAHLAHARLLERLQAFTHAEDAYQEIRDRFPQSEEATYAAERIGQLADDKPLAN
jgi:regulator of sirC expression with transglutaminase-like and TPR domain